MLNQGCTLQEGRSPGTGLSTPELAKDGLAATSLSQICSIVFLFCRSHLVGNDFLTVANLLECVKEFWHGPFEFSPLVSPLWPLLHGGWPVPIITKSFPLLLCQYARYTFLCWAKALLKMKLVRHTSYTLALLRMHTHNSSHGRFIFLLELKWWVVRNLNCESGTALVFNLHRSFCFASLISDKIQMQICQSLYLTLPTREQSKTVLNQFTPSYYNNGSVHVFHVCTKQTYILCSSWSCFLSKLPSTVWRMKWHLTG